MWHAFPGLPGGRYRRYLSLREGSVTEQIGAPKALVRMSPFPSPPDDSRSVLAVKGSLCRFAPWSACGPIRRDGCLRGKGGVGPCPGRKEPFGRAPARRLSGVSVVAPSTCSLLLVYVGGMVEERWVCNVGGMVVENSPESHKPVGIGDLRASSDSEDWEAPRSKPARHGRDGPLRGRKWLFHEA